MIRGEPAPRFAGLDRMSENPNVGASTHADTAVPSSKKIVMLGLPPLYGDALQCLIESRIPRSTVTTVTGENGLLEAAADVVLVGADLERMTEAGLARLTSMVSKLAPRPVLLIATALHPTVLQRLLREGVAGVVLQSSASATLVDAIESVSGGKVWLPRDLLAEAFGESSHVRHRCSEAGRIAQLTRREREIVAVASAGLTNRQIATRLQISEPTVRHHLSSVFSKLGVTNRGELIIFAYRHGLVDEADRQRLC